MIVAARKDLNEALKWSKKNSPIAYFVLPINGKWGVPNENPENIVAAFKKLWPETRAFKSRILPLLSPLFERRQSGRHGSAPVGYNQIGEREHHVHQHKTRAQGPPEANV